MTGERIRVPVEPREDTPGLQARFDTFHQANPAVYERLVEMTFQAQAAGVTRIGIARLFEVLRWEASLRTRAVDEFKLNNDYRAPYARLIMKDYPRFAGIFETRESRVDHT